MKSNNLIQRLIEYFRPTETGSIEDVRSQVLRIVSWVMVIAGLTLMQISYGGLRPLFEGNFSELYITSLFSFTALLILTLFSNRVSYNIRAFTVIFIALSQGVLNMNGSGLTSDAIIWLMFANLFSTILVGLGTGLIMNLVSILTTGIYGYLAVSGQIVLGGENTAAYNANIDSWTNIVAPFLLVSMILTLVIGLILRGVERSREELQDSLKENEKVTAALEQEQNMLALQTLDLERRLTQIRTAAEISRSLGTILEPEALMQEVADLIKDRFDLYYVGVFQVDDNRRYAKLAAGTGEAGQRMLEANHQLAIGGASMVGWSISHGEPRISLDVGQDAIRFRNPNLPDTRSELALPIRIGTQATGAISVQSTLPEAFDDDDITILQGIADSLAIALENASLFQQFESSLKEIRKLNRQYMSDSWQNVWAENSQEMATERGSVPANESLNDFNIPLRLRGEQVIGNITLSTEQSNLSTDDMEFVEAISNQAALALESARLLDEANRRVEQERALQNLTNRFSRSLDFESLLKTIVEEIGQIPMIRQTAIHVTPPEMLAQESQQD